MKKKKSTSKLMVLMFMLLGAPFVSAQKDVFLKNNTPINGISR